MTEYSYEEESHKSWLTFLQPICIICINASIKNLHCVIKQNSLNNWPELCMLYCL